MTDTSDATPPREEAFGSFEQLQKAHVGLMTALKPNQQSVENAGDTQSQIQSFVRKAKNTGAVIGDAAERAAAQNILDYWSAETISISDVAQKNWSPDKLAPFDPSASSGEAGAQSKEAVAHLQQARSKIQTAALARLWRDSGRTDGYLLTGSALEQAQIFARDDRDIEELVTASRSAAKIRKRNIFLVLAFVILCAVIAWLLIDRENTRRELEAQRTAMIAERTAQSNVAQLGTQEAKIRALTEELKSAKLPVSSDISETVPDALVVQSAKPKPDGSTAPANQPLRGYIWIGSDVSSNLLDMNGQAVKPSSAVPGESYKVSKNLVLRTALPSADYIQSDSKGIVPEQTVVTLKSAPVSYRRPTPASLAPKAAPSPGAAPGAIPPTTLQYWAEVDVQYSDQPIVYLEYAGADPSAAQSLAQKLRERGFRVPGVEATDLAKGLDEIRFYVAADKTAADKLATALNSSIQDLKFSGVQTVKVADMTAQKGARNYPGVLELWIDLSSVK